jgi:hypothetical protein
VSETAIVQFDEYQISIDTLRKLPADHVAAFAALSYAVTETNILRKIFLAQSHDYIGEKVFDEAISAQRFLVLRTWSSKLFEAKEFLESLFGRKAKVKDQLLNRLAEDAAVDFERSASLEGYAIARDIRHEMANHYLFEVARKNLPHVHSGALCNMYTHQNGGNDFFPLGEAVMFQGRLNRKWREVDTAAGRQAKLDHWFEWCLNVNTSLQKSHAMFAGELIFPVVGRNTFYRKSYWVPKAMVGHQINHLTPLIFREDETP